MLKKIVFTGIQLLLAALFLFSGFSKIAAFNDFVYFIYGLLDWPLMLVDFISYLIIMLEIIIGVCFLLLGNNKKLILGTIAFIVALSVFIALFPVEDCHCFGEYYKLNTLETLLKNGVILAGLIVLYSLRKSAVEFRYQQLITIIVSAIAIIVTTFIQPPQVVSEIIYGVKTLKGHKMSNAAELLDMLEKYDLNKEKSIAIMASPKCKYCRTEMKKLNKLLRCNDLEGNSKCIIFGDEKDSVVFNNEVNTHGLASRLMNPFDFNQLTQGKLPAVLFIKEKDVYYLRGVEVTEKIINEFKDL